MTTFVPPKRKMLELLLLPVLCSIFYVLYPEIDAIILFGFGFVWNWSASNDLNMLFQNKRYRMSMLKLVVNLQNSILKPFAKFPDIIKRMISILPAGLFWTMVLFVNESMMPWWATFIGSIAFEIMQIELKFIRSQKRRL
jgi:hypothetical protein